MVLKHWKKDLIISDEFENDVKMYGTQTEYLRSHILHRLRMM